MGCQTHGICKDAIQLYCCQVLLDYMQFLHRSGDSSSWIRDPESGLRATWRGPGGRGFAFRLNWELLVVQRIPLPDSLRQRSTTIGFGVGPGPLGLVFLVQGRIRVVPGGNGVRIPEFPVPALDPDLTSGLRRSPGTMFGLPRGEDLTARSAPGF
jgi:hypothetical protein